MYCVDYQRPLFKYKSTKCKLDGAGADCRDDDVMPSGLQLDIFVGVILSCHVLPIHGIRPAADHASSIQTQYNQVSRPTHKRPLSMSVLVLTDKFFLAHFLVWTCRERYRTIPPVLRHKNGLVDTTKSQCTLIPRYF